MKEPLDEMHLRQWIGRSVTEHDELSLFSVRGLAALLDRDPAAFRKGTTLPHGWHWLYFKPTTPQSQLGDDGHARRGDFLPPVPLPRRMWAGGRLRFQKPLLLGETAQRTSTIRDVVLKQGRSGRLVFVTVNHAVSGPAGLACDEDQLIVYRDHTSHEAATPARSADSAELSVWHESFLPTTVALFRFSALTFNGHRIHYDHRWATEREGYPAVVVHAPLTALLLLDAAIRHHDSIDPVAFEYRARSPLFADQTIALRGGVPSIHAQSLTATGPDGALAMTATVEWPPTPRTFGLPNKDRK